MKFAESSDGICSAIYRFLSQHIGEYFQIILPRMKGKLKMDSIFNPDSKFFQYCNMAADLLLLNILAVICSLPIITIGATSTSMYFVLYKMSNGDDAHLFRCFFKAFKQNFAQATVLWCIYLVLGGSLLSGGYLLMQNNQLIHSPFPFFLFFGIVVIFISLSWVFILQSRYQNSALNTIKNSIIFGISQLKTTIFLILLNLIPLLSLAFLSAAWPFFALIGFSITGFLQVLCSKRVFMKCGKRKDAEENLDC